MANNGAADRVVALRFEQNEILVKRWLNLSEILPVLLENGLVDCDDRDEILSRYKTSRDESFQYLRRRLSAKETHVYVKFCHCLRQKHAQVHLGHEHVADLLEGKEFSPHEKAQRERSGQIRETMRQNETKLQVLLNLSALVPHLNKYSLVTPSELDYLSRGHMEPSETIQQFLRILDTKGPTAHCLFLRCLAEECTHPGHAEIKDVLIKAVGEEKQGKPPLSATNPQSGVSSDHHGDELQLVVKIPRTPHRIRLRGVLGNRQYVDRMRELQFHRYHGNWDRFNNIIRRLVKSRSIDLKVFGMLAKAVASIIEGKTEETMQLVDQAERLCNAGKLQHSNGIIMLGRCLYIRSAVYRHKKDYKRAKEYLDYSKQVLLSADIEPGEDTASIYYHTGTLALDCQQEDKKDAIEAFTNAISHAERDDSGLPLIGWHSRVFSAFLFMGSTHNNFGQTKPSAAYLTKAENILPGEPEVEDLPDRTKALCFIAKSDVKRWQENIKCAVAHAQRALGIADSCRFAFEKKYAYNRLKLLKTFQECSYQRPQLKA